jgi:hypothetical protein
MDVIWIAVFAALTGTGVAIAVTARTRLWTAAGLAFALGGLGYGTWAVFRLSGVFDPPAYGAAADVATWFGVAGALSIFAGMLVTLVALGQTGRRRFLVVFAAATLAVGMYEFWTSNWAARTGDVATRCSNTGHDFNSRSSIQRMPPGVRCLDGSRQVFVPADAICWLALAGWSLFFAFVLSFPVLGMGWVVRRWPMLRPA